MSPLLARMKRLRGMRAMTCGLPYTAHLKPANSNPGLGANALGDFPLKVSTTRRGLAAPRAGAEDRGGDVVGMFAATDSPAGRSDPRSRALEYPHAQFGHLDTGRGLLPVDRVVPGRARRDDSTRSSGKVAGEASRPGQSQERNHPD